MDLIHGSVFLLTVMERLVEVVVSNRNLRWSLSQGGREYGQSHYPLMVLLHSSFFAAVAVEHVFLQNRLSPVFEFMMLGLVILCQILRWWIIATLGQQWNTRVVIVPGMPRVKKGIYRYLNHPNYAVVVLELLVFSLYFGAYWTMLIYSILNVWLLSHRIQVENQALCELKADKF